MCSTTFDGQRTAFMAFDLLDASGIPPFSEPFFRELSANFQIAPVMDADDLQQGLARLGGATGFYRPRSTGTRPRLAALTRAAWSASVWSA